MAWPYIAAGASILGSIFGQESTNSSNETIARDANTAAQHNADLQMAFQERMSNTAHQREMVDLQKAGLNPLLALNTGASTPQGAAGGVATATLKNSLEGLGASAMEMMRLKNDLKKQESEIGLMDAQKKKADTESAVIKRGIPEAELKNDMYDVVRPWVKKVKESMQSSGGLPETSEKNLKVQKELKLQKP